MQQHPQESFDKKKVSFKKIYWQDLVKRPNYPKMIQELTAVLAKYNLDLNVEFDDNMVATDVHIVEKVDPVL